VGIGVTSRRERGGRNGERYSDSERVRRTERDGVGEREIERA